MAKHAEKTYTCTECPQIFHSKNAKDKHWNKEHISTCDTNLNSLILENTESTTISCQTGSHQTFATEITKDLQWTDDIRSDTILSDTQMDLVTFESTTNTCQLCFQTFTNKFDKDLHWNEEHSDIILYDAYIESTLGSTPSTIKDFYEFELDLDEV